MPMPEYTAYFPGVVWHGQEIPVGATITVEGEDDERDVVFWLKTGKLSGGGYVPPATEAETETPPDDQPPEPPSGATKPISTREPTAHVGRRHRRT